MEWDENVEGGLSYGSNISLKPSSNPHWGTLISPADGTILGYVPHKGLEKIPAPPNEPISYQMVLKDSPPLYLVPGKADSKYSLRSKGFSLIKGETVAVRGSLGDQVLIEFTSLESSYLTKLEAFKARYAWGNSEDFEPLVNYSPNNSSLNRDLIPTHIRVGVKNLESGDEDRGILELNDSLLAKIYKNGFVVEDEPLIRTSIQVDDLADYYNETGEAVVDFLSFDIFLHSFHLLFDGVLQKIEENYLGPTLKKALEEILEELNKNSRAFSGPSLKSYKQIKDMLSVTLALISPTGSKITLSPAAADEYRLCLNAKNTETSPLTGEKIDYTLFKPRGHYTISEFFQRYFRAVSYLGLAELQLFDSDGKTPLLDNFSAAAIFYLAVQAREKVFTSFEEPINFLIGVPNSGDALLFRYLVTKTLGLPQDKQSYLNINDQSKIMALSKEVLKYIKGPLIQSVPGQDAPGDDFSQRRPVFRLSGKRFTFDAYIFNLLTSPRTGSLELPRNLPQATDVMAVLGAQAAEKVSVENNEVYQYRKNLNLLKEMAPSYLAKEVTVYAKWLSVFKAYFIDSFSDQFFYRSAAWQWKKLIAALSSYAELKRDTILYTEQSMAELGGSDEVEATEFAPPKPRGYVEPDPQAFKALLDAVMALRKFVADYDLLPEIPLENQEFAPENYERKLVDFSIILKKASQIAQKEVRGEPITASDYETIKTIGLGFNSRLLAPSEGNTVSVEDNLKMAIVADVATNGFDGVCLEIATGVPRRIYVFVNDKSGGPRLTRGFIYSYYEFARPLTQGRLTDQQWRKLVYDRGHQNQLKELHPHWYSNLN
ncbi:MAG: DUF3160 domain-containing protein [Deltaproteobacteria bacterium]|nr:DUF3160 domain-containing protein [Deltaproteobacteria bacterium]